MLFAATAPEPPRAPFGGEGAPTFEAVYSEHFAFVWRNVKRLGVPEALVDDAVQEVFLAVHRGLGEFEGRSALRTWLFGILANVASHYRRTIRRKSAEGHLGVEAVEADAIPDETVDDPHDQMAKLEGVRLLHRLLDELDDEKRAALVLSELEQMSAPEIAEALGVNVNTVYARIRAARQQFNQAVAREKARATWRQR
jgi:RNA polymerase sigma-70 factor (ECF subfamily)